MIEFGPAAVELDITTFRGMSVNAEHYYATLKVQNKWDRAREGNGQCTNYKYPDHPMKTHDVFYHLTAKQALLMNKKDSDGVFTSGFAHRWKRGDQCTRFFERDRIVDLAIEQFNDVYDPTTDILIFTIVDPNDPLRDKTLALAGPEDTVNRFNQLEGYGPQSRFLFENRFTWTGLYYD